MARSRQSSPFPALPLSPAAQDILEIYGRGYVDRMMPVAVRLATREGSSQIQPEHLRKAKEQVEKDLAKGGMRDFVLFLGSAGFGAAVPGIIDGYQENDVDKMLVYTIVGFVGLVLGLLGAFNL